MIWLQRRRIDNLLDRELDVRLQHFRQMAFMIRRQMDDHDKGEPGFGGNVVEKRLERAQAACRSAYPNNRGLFRGHVRIH